MTFADAMIRRMHELGMRPSELADRSGVSKPYISQLMNGKIVDPTWVKACAIIAALDLTVSEFAARQRGGD